ncbi:AAA family ATPase [Microvirga sp. STR05]|nr:AAA family ATPase [Microvirga sp. STR05]
MVFQKTDGVFYRIAKRARDEYQRQTATPDAPVAVGFEEVFNQLMDPLVERDEEIVLPMKAAGYQFSIVDFGDGYITFKRGKDGHLVNVQNSTLKSLYEGTLVQPNPSGNQIYHQAIVKRLHELSEQTDTAPVETMPEPPRNYVLIIDEINRANIAKVFGELITLLEKDKRLGGSNTLPVTLPSGETNFTVPVNLYVIGTMNTADRSLALLDIALRRRFEFRPLYPLDKINNEPIPHAAVLKALNERIRHHKSRDFQIGHAYFLNPQETLPAIFNGKVIPLLYEYFLNDEAKVQTLLTEANIPCYLDETVGLRYGTAS